MKELVVTHLFKDYANIVLVDYYRATAKVKRVPNTPELQKLLQSGQLREQYSELRDGADVWLMDAGPRRGWLVVSQEGFIGYTLERNLLETDDAAYLTAFVDLPDWTIKSKVFVVKALYTERRVKVRQYVKAAGKLTPEIAGAFKHMLGRHLTASEDDEWVCDIELWGHTLNRLYGSEMELLDPQILSSLNWMQPKIWCDVVLWRGLNETLDRTMYVYLKGDTVLYVGYETLREVSYYRHTQPKVIDEVITYENLLTPSCEGALVITGEYFRLAGMQVRVYRERLPTDLRDTLFKFLKYSMVLLGVDYFKMPVDSTLSNEDVIQVSYLYDIVNNKIYLFKSISHSLGAYYGEMTVGEWQTKNIKME